MTSSDNSPKNWSEWNNTKHFTDYARDSGTGKFVRFTIAALLFVPVGFLAYMTTIQLKMKPGTIDLIIFGLIFIGLQAWWIIPIVRKNNSSDEKSSNLRKEINQLEKLYKK